MRQKHIVLSEDETPARTTLKIILVKAGYRVTAVTNGTEALDLLVSTVQNRETVDLLVTDIRMPGLTGMELIDELKKSNIEIPVLVITGFGSKEMVIQLMRKGCNDFIEKPFEPGEVLKRVEEVLKKKELEQVKWKTSRETLEMETYKQELPGFDPAV
jgi:DNA-binding NtrC family response regulator